MKTILFLLPGHGMKPIGGHKIVYEYANRLFKNGYNVKIVYGAACLFKRLKLYKKVRAIIMYLFFSISKKYYPYKWFNLNRDIEVLFKWDLKQKNVVTSDIVFATSVETSFYLNNYKDLDRKNMYYLIQGFENWHWDTNMVIDSWKFDLEKIVIAPWLKKIGDDLQVKTTLIENGFDFEVFDIDIKIEDKNSNSITMLYHKNKIKGSEDGFKALNIVKEKHKSLNVILFGTYSEPEGLPDWYTYYQLPSQKKLRYLYNSSAIFIGTSHTEGWGLTVGEAMQCGCAVVCTDNDGYKTMAIDNETALVSPIKNPKALSENIIKLIDDNHKRMRIAKSGYEYIHKYSIENSFSKLLNLIENNR